MNATQRRFQHLDRGDRLFVTEVMILVAGTGVLSLYFGDIGVKIFGTILVLAALGGIATQLRGLWHLRIKRLQQREPAWF